MYLMTCIIFPTIDCSSEACLPAKKFESDNLKIQKSLRFL